MIRLVLADDHTIVRAGIRQLLSTDDHLQIVGEACNGDEVLACVRSLDVDVLLLDMSMPGKNGIELIERIKQEKPKLRILILSMHEEIQYIIRAMRAGASGYLIKGETPEQLIIALHKVASGGIFLTSTIAEQLVCNTLQENKAPSHALLSNREFQVFSLLAAGKTVSEIAEQLFLSSKTISTHKTRLMQKMNLNNQSELVRYALAHQLL
jgi:DNA-binding NarL/FixJ family response regulator